MQTHLLIYNVAQSKDDHIVGTLQSLVQINDDHVVVHDIIDITLRTIHRFNRLVLFLSTSTAVRTGVYNSLIASMS